MLSQASYVSDEDDRQEDLADNENLLSDIELEDTPLMALETEEVKQDPVIVSDDSESSKKSAINMSP